MSEGFRDLSPIPNTSNMVSKESLANTPPPETQEGIFRNLQVGIGSEAFRVTEEGMWLGAENYIDAPFRVDMEGNVELTGYIAVGGAAADVNAGTVTIDGGKITAESIESNQIASNAIISRLIASEQVLATHIKANTITANEIAANTITASEVAANVFVATGGAAGDVNAGTTTIDGGKITTNTITATQIAADTITGTQIKSDAIETKHLKSDTIETKHIKTDQITTNRINNAAVDGNKIANNAVENKHVLNVSADKLNAGTIKVGGTARPNSITIRDGGASDNFLVWRSSEDVLRGRIWADGDGYMGLQGVGARIYFYCGSNLSGAGVLRLVLYSGSTQNTMYGGFETRGNFNVWANQDGSGYRLGVGSTMNVNVHVNQYGAAGTHNIGGSSTYFNYMNARGFTTHSLTSFDSPVKMPSGEEVDDITALKMIKERKELKDKTSGRALLDKRSFPIDTQVKAYDSETGEQYPRDKNDDPVIEGKSRPDADAVDLVQFTSLLFGALKQLAGRVEELEKECNKNVKI